MAFSCRSALREDHRLAGAEVPRDRAERHGKAVEVARDRVARRGQVLDQEAVDAVLGQEAAGQAGAFFQSKLTPATEA